jgi:hypothetical protein
VAYFCARRRNFLILKKRSHLGGPARSGIRLEGIGFRLRVEGKESDGERLEVDDWKRGMNFDPVVPTNKRWFGFRLPMGNNGGGWYTVEAKRLNEITSSHQFRR